MSGLGTMKFCALIHSAFTIKLPLSDGTDDAAQIMAAGPYSTLIVTDHRFFRATVPRCHHRFLIAKTNIIEVTKFHSTLDTVDYCAYFSDFADSLHALIASVR